MHRSDVRDDADVRSRDLRQEGDVAALVHTHLEDGAIVIGRESEEGERDADLSVQVGFALEDVEARAEDGRNQLFAGCLADAAGDADHAKVGRRAAAVRGYRLEGLGAARYLEGACIFGQRQRPLDDGASRTGSDRARGEIVAVCVFTRDCEEEITGLCFARVD